MFASTGIIEMTQAMNPPKVRTAPDEDRALADMIQRGREQGVAVDRQAERDEIDRRPEELPGARRLAQDVVMNGDRCAGESASPRIAKPVAATVT